MDYKQVLDFLYSSLPMYQRIGRAAYKSDLDTTVRLDNYFGNPHRSFRSIHIAGTNGKGSVSHMLSSVLQSAGYRTGLYTSPHLTDFRERIRVDGKMISKEYITAFVKDNKEIIKKLEPSFFEMTVAMAFLYFKWAKTDIAVIETGMGGRLDSTNIIIPEISVITNIGLDHMQFLGDTPEKIAAEKAGIIKDRVPVIIGESNEKTDPVFTAKARETNSDICFADKRYSLEKVSRGTDPGSLDLDVYLDGQLFMKKVSTDMTGDYQLKNIATVLQTVELAGRKNEISPGALRSGLKNVKENTGFCGRWQKIRQEPLVICDSAHNYDGLKIVIGQLTRLKRDKLHIILGLVNDKDADGILDLFPVSAQYYFTRASIPRALDEHVLLEKAAGASLKGAACRSVSEAYASALANAGKRDIIFVGGSTFVVADFLKITGSCPA